MLPAAAIAGGRGVAGCISLNSIAISARTDADIPDDEQGTQQYFIHEGVRRSEILELFCTGKSFQDTYILEHKIGEGGFGKVYQAKHTALGIRRAVKRIKKTNSPAESSSPLKSEIATLMALDHPHVVRLVEFYDSVQYLYLIFELCQGPDLFERVVRGPERRMSEADASVALRHILKALQCCHAQFRGHYDIKPENFMYATESLDDLLMIDLGHSGSFDLNRKKKIKGTPAYMAPEFWDGIYGPEGDIWSCGVLLYVMLTGKNFFPEDMPTATRKREIKVRAFIKEQLASAAQKFSLSGNAQDLLRLMLMHDRHGRPTVREALNHPFTMSGIESEKACPDAGMQGRFREAQEFQASLPATIRRLAAEPILKRIARLVIAHISPPSEPERLVFRMLDMHGYGELSISVLEESFVRRGAPVPDDIDQLFELADLNHDGYISYLAFLAVCLPLEHLTNQPFCKVAFDILDRDGNGVIDCDDIAAPFGHEPGSDVCRTVMAEVSSESRLSWDQFNLMMRCIDASFVT